MHNFVRDEHHPGEDGKDQVFPPCWVFTEMTVDRCAAIAANMGGKRTSKVTIRDETLPIAKEGFYTSKSVHLERGGCRDPLRLDALVVVYRPLKGRFPLLILP